MLSAQANALSARIDQQDALYVAALVEGAHPQLLARIHAVRCDLVREWGAVILRDEFDAHIPARSRSITRASGSTGLVSRPNYRVDAYDRIQARLRAKPRRDPAFVWCDWCGAKIRPAVNIMPPGGVSSGICETCAKRVFPEPDGA